MFDRKNNSVIWSAGNQLNLLLKVQSDKKMVIILTSMTTLYFVAILTLSFFIGTENIGKAIIPFILFTIIIVLFPVRFLLWNKYGEENIIITNSTLNYSFSYGFYTTQLNTFKFNFLGKEFIKERAGDEINVGEFVIEKESYGTIAFYREDPETNLPIHFYETTVQISYDEYLIFEDQMDEFFSNNKGSIDLNLN